jgi:predicted nucleotidyltransferase
VGPRPLAALPPDPNTIDSAPRTRDAPRCAQCPGVWVDGRGDARPNSDIDLLIEIVPGRTLLDLIALEQDLEELLGHPVDVLTAGGLSPYLQKRILAEAAAL